MLSRITYNMVALLIGFVSLMGQAYGANCGEPTGTTIITIKNMGAYNDYGNIYLKSVGMVAGQYDVSCWDTSQANTPPTLRPGKQGDIIACPSPTSSAYTRGTITLIKPAGTLAQIQFYTIASDPSNWYYGCSFTSGGTGSNCRPSIASGIGRCTCDIN